MQPVGVAKERKKGQKLSYVKLAICPDHPRRRRPLKFCMRGHVREIFIYFKFHENLSRVSDLWRVENRALPLTWPMAYTTACTTVQAVITKIWSPYRKSRLLNTMVTADFRPEAELTLFLCMRAKEIARSLGKCIPIEELFPFYKKSRSPEWTAGSDLRPEAFK